MMNAAGATPAAIILLTDAPDAHSNPFFARLRASDPVYRTTLPDKTALWKELICRLPPRRRKDCSTHDPFR